MLKISAARERGSRTWLVFVIGSAALHGLLYGAGSELSQPPPASHGPIQASIRVKTPPPPPPAPPPLPALRQPPPPKPNRQPRRLAQRRRPAKPEPPRPAAPKPRAKPLFGVSAGSVAEGDSGVAVSLGDTLAAEQAPTAAPAKPLPTPPAPPPPPPPPRRPRPVPIYRLTKPPAFSRRVQPRYPHRAKREGVEGTVLLEVLLDERGRVVRVRVLNTPAQDLAKAAIAAVRSSSLTPGLVGRKPVPVKLKIPYRFVLDG